MKEQGYALIDSGNGKKLERFGPYLIERPCAQAIWMPTLGEKEWQLADASFVRGREKEWLFRKTLPSDWRVEVEGVRFKLSPTDFGHLGIFPEQRPFWKWIQEIIQARKTASFTPNVLNLFAYSGGSTLAAARAGAAVCHLDASKGMVAWARENAALNDLTKAPIRWIVEDVQKFLQREQKRGVTYDAIILDPPSFGRGTKGEVFKIEETIIPLLQACKALLSKKPLFVFFSCHTPGFTPLAMHHLMQQVLGDLKGHCSFGEMTLQGELDDQVLEVPSGTFAKWESYDY